MTTCPKCQHEFQELIPGFRTHPEFVEQLSSDAHSCYVAVCPTQVVLGVETIPAVKDVAPELQFLTAVSEVTLAQSFVHDDAEKIDFALMLKRVAHAYNRGVQEGWFIKGVLMELTSVRLATLDARSRTLLAIYPRVREDLRGEAGRNRLNALFGQDLFRHEGELPWREPWDRYAAANGLE